MVPKVKELKARDFRTAVEAIVELECLQDSDLGGPILAAREIKHAKVLPDTKEGAVLQRVLGLLELADIDVDMTRFSIPCEMSSGEWFCLVLEYVGRELLGLGWIGDSSDIFAGASDGDSSRARQAGGT